ncbi:rhodanese-like domain-containing protein [Rubrivirga sp. S365]|uniref:rhodanese-like domain-containing protein n=1 Tax=Rubrivirga sp. S365 TaxID=3076080 RepID=UPI0028CAB4F4|nr:rhodanese-like domain-containing protein [Rubrivirga sp. S365]MDT7856069.1 rhodanese-like domain-containing protein [Rubrivirga sp. S365]
MSHSPRFVALVDRARADVTETSIAAVRERVERGGDVVLVDVREADEWTGGHLPGARHVSRGVLERDIEETFPDLDAPLVLYCGGGYRSALAARSLGEMGYTNVQSMTGGWRAWTEAGYPTEGGPTETHTP